MRPKKVVLVLCPNCTELGVLMFALSIRGFRVVGCNTIDEAHQIERDHHIDGVLSCLKVPHTRTVPVVIKGSMDMMATVEALKRAMTTKPGPKKKVDRTSAIVQN